MEDLRSTTVSDDPVQRRDLILLERARGGDLDAFNDLVVLYQDQLFALVVRMVPDRDQASDCVQEAFFSAYRNLTSFRGGSVKSWLNRICVNAAMDTQRARKRRPVQPYPEFDDESWQPPAGAEADPERTAMLSERTRALSGALAGITDDQRSAIVLYDIEGYDYAEIAEMTGVSLGTVKSRIHRGRLALRDLLGDRMELFRGDLRESHDGHDPVVIARLLDREIAADERAAAESLIASCASCATLHADLVALAAANRAQPTPAPHRSFTLSADDAARLAAQVTGEPGDATARLSGVMTDLSPASDHASHDTISVASLADHSLPATERAAAEALVASCSQCADLQADLLALRAATRAMPTPARPTDYTLTESDAARLRSGGWRRFAAILGTSRDALSRPLAIGLTTLGLAGLLVTAAPSLMFGSASSGAAPTTVGAPAGDAAAATNDGSTKLGAAAVPEASAAAAAAGSAAPVAGGIYGSAVDQTAAPAPVPPQAAIADGATQPPGTEANTNGSERTQAGTTGGKSQEPASTSDLLAAQEIGGISPLPVLSVAFLVAGLALFALRWTARRFDG